MQLRNAFTVIENLGEMPRAKVILDFDVHGKME